ncbi:hypothetical protein IMZ48_12595 [Candidatus Bathyarchaeota archaeon]|nr:hypothetical protein [Candidatus Bathyarchaeota archaeon]
MDHQPNRPKIGVIGAGSMGGRMCLLFAEHGLDVHSLDPSPSNAEALNKQAHLCNLAHKVTHHTDYASLCRAFSTPKAFVLSVPHGHVVDEVIDGLSPFLEPSDLIMDAGNERWTETERRQRRLEPHGVHYVGMGVSGGYQDARRGPSISPGGTKEALDLAFPFLEKVAAKSPEGQPCVAKLGPGGCGHYVKMIHNGIEHGMLTSLTEAWGIMSQGLGMRNGQIADVLEAWDSKGPLKDNYIVSIGSDICRTMDPKTGRHVLENIRDKVVQDADGTEGTGVWTCEEAIRLHVPAPTLTAAHMFRVASADAASRDIVSGAFQGYIYPGRLLAVDRREFLADLHAATYAGVLASFIQGLNLLAKADAEHGWGLDFTDVLQLWRSGCVIRSNRLSSLLASVYASHVLDKTNLLGHLTVASKFTWTYASLKNVVLRGMEADLNVPALSATLEYYKYSGYTDMPTSFQEAELDYFGEHRFDLKSEGPGEPGEPGGPVVGSHHFEWKPAGGNI